MIITPFNPHLIIDISIRLTTLIFPLHIAAIPIYVRVSVAVLREVDHGLVEATLTKGGSIQQIIVKILIPKSLPGLILGIALTIISLIRYSTLTVAIDGGSPGDLAIHYGFQRFENTIKMVIFGVILIFLVQFV